MAAATTRKTFKYKLQPTPAQAAQLGATLRACRELYNAALQERRDAWRMRRVSITYYQQKAELPEIRQIREDCAAVHSQVLQDVVLRVHRTFQAFFRRVANGETRFKGRQRYHSFTYPQWGNGATWLATGCCSPKSGIWKYAGAVPWKAHPRRRPSREKPMGGTCASPVPRCPCSPCP